MEQEGEPAMMTREEAIKALRLERGIEINGNAVRVAEFLQGLDVAISALRPVSREQVEKVWRGVWKHYLPPLGAGNIQCRCTKCGRTPDVETPFCAWCGAPMTDEAVEMVMERLEALKDAD